MEKFKVSGLKVDYLVSNGNEDFLIYQIKRVRPHNMYFIVNSGFSIDFYFCSAKNMYRFYAEIKNKLQAFLDSRC